MMRRTMIGGMLIALTLMFLSAICYAESVPRMTKEELKAQMADPSVAILDVRTDFQWKDTDKKIKGAVRVNPWNVDSWTKNYPKDKKLVLYCA